jgi:hypothetical protein
MVLADKEVAIGTKTGDNGADGQWGGGTQRLSLLASGASASPLNA